MCYNLYRKQEIILKILLIEDNLTIIKGLKYNLEINDFVVLVASCIKDAKEYLINDDPELIILDITLPDGNGLDLYENMIKEKNIPTIVLTAKDEEDDIVRGLELGADEYITKPFYTKELITRINRLLLKRKKNSSIKIDDIMYNYDKMEIYKDNRKIDLSMIEIEIINVLFNNLNKVVSRDVLLDKIWEITGNDVDDHTITVYIKRIREKIGTDIIVTVKGIGYRIDYEK